MDVGERGGGGGARKSTEGENVVVMYCIREDLFSIRKENEHFESANFSLYLVFILIVFSKM